MKIYYTHNYRGLKGESHKLLERAIAAYIEDDERAGELVSSLRMTGEYGKPVIDDFKDFSISHSGSTWAVLFADVPCGLDVQYEREADIEGIAKRFYAGEDARLITSADGIGRRDAFFRIWARREALVKAAGTSVAGSDIPPVSEDDARYEGRLWSIRDVHIPARGLHSAAAYLSGDANSSDSISPEEMVY